MSTKIVNVGIVGGGLMGREIAAAIQRWPALIDHPVRPRLTAVADINPAALAWFDEIDTVRAWSPTIHDLLSDDALDVVYVAVRHDLHEQIYGDVIRSGKSLLAEKPFGIDSAAAQSIMNAIREHPESFVRCSSEMPYFPGAQWAIDYVRSGALGTIIEARNSFLHSSDIDPNKPLNWKRQNAVLRQGRRPQRPRHAHLARAPPSRLGPRERLRGAAEHRDRAARPGRFARAVRHLGQRRDPQLEPSRRDSVSPDDRDQAHRSRAQEHLGVRGRWARGRSPIQHQESQVRRGVHGVRRWRGSAGSRSGNRSTRAVSPSGRPSPVPIFETGFSDSILQMWAAFLAEREGLLGDRFGTVRPEEAALTHTIYDAAIASHQTQVAVRL